MTTGDPNTSVTQSNDTVRKVFRITDHCAIDVSGSGEIGVTLIEEFQKSMSVPNSENLTVTEISKNDLSFEEEIAKYVIFLYNFPVKTSQI